MPVPGQGFSTFFEVPTQIMVDGLPNDNELSLTLIGGTVCSVLLLMVCIVAVLLWILYRQKGSYVTNELDEEGTYQDEEYVDIEMQQQSQIPLAAEEDE
ncbi:hypothetical protein PBY51_016847 [Eleginops maclovinus]|uniref:Uncharacterized protein n=1 Tax=Eleginops maclovinus TaxID=56733 RepID=A0AAN7WM71_ELEMC|nr:hypothetical protein PBY51_016847 [Eleginops maclovinus]